MRPFTSILPAFFQGACARQSVNGNRKRCGKRAPSFSVYNYDILHFYFHLLTPPTLYKLILIHSLQIYPEESYNMSSLSRRACFKCGNVGHYAGEPTSLLVCRRGRNRMCCRKTAPSALPASRRHEPCDTLGDTGLT